MARLSNLRYLTRTPTGMFGIRIRVPRDIQAQIGCGEVWQTLGTDDPGKVELLHAQAVAAVKARFADAKRKTGLGHDVIFAQVLHQLRNKGLQVSDQGVVTPPRHDPSDPRDDPRDAMSVAADATLADAGFSDEEELATALAAYPKGKAPANLQRVSTTLAVLAGAPRRLTFSYCLSVFLAKKARKRDTSKRDWIRYEAAAKRFVARLIDHLGGDREITAVTRDEAEEHVEKLEDAGLKPASVEREVKFLSTLVSWTIRKHTLAAANPFEKLEIATPADYDDTGVSFERSEVRTLLASTGTLNDEAQEIARLLACTGSRMAEITGLLVKDVLASATVLDIRFNSIRRLKNLSSVRQTPIVDAACVEALKARVKGRKPSDPVFPRYGNEDGAANVSAVVSKWLTKIKLRDPKATKPKTAHSLRHTFEDVLREVEKSKTIRDMIQGHTAGDAASDYGSDELIKIKREAMERAWHLIIPTATLTVVGPDHSH
ncbi:tyrosine-type recombinase/integrase [Bradyrhizobium diazoefficiens]|nr:DUF6538 domain-containing protein [Bradyrhizobium diazoefficiens]QQO21809.1 tyrosine-type recombinase/integrase [Bradyrhizobium diazoefficiens]